MTDNTTLENLTTAEIIEALNEPLQESANSLDMSIDELKALGVRDISNVDIKATMDEALKNIQVQRTLQDLTRESKDKKSIRDYLEHHIKFLQSISPGKTLAFIVNNMTVEHASAVLTTTAKMTNVDDKIIRKHLKILKKKYN